MTDHSEQRCFLAEHGFTHDIFISYAHGPRNSEGHSPLQSWSRQFRNLLESNLQMFGVSPVGLWFDDSDDHDRRLDPNEDLDEQFTRLIRGAAMLQVHVSDHYLASLWCRRELQKWVESLPDKPGAKDRRISVIRLTDTLGREWPEPLAPHGEQLPGIIFHGPGDRVPMGFNLNWGGNAPSQEFNTQIINVAAVISRRLQELDEQLKRQRVAQSQVSQLKSGAPEAIYLHGRASHAAEWRRTREELLDLGLEVRPTAPAPDDDEGSAWTSLSRIASRCDAMLLLGADRYELDDDLDVIGRDQRSYIEARFQRYLPCAVVDCSGIGDDAFMSAARTRGIDWLDATRNGWNRDVPPWLAHAAGTAARKYGVGDRPAAPAQAANAPAMAGTGPAGS